MSVDFRRSIMKRSIIGRQKGFAASAESDDDDSETTPPLRIEDLWRRPLDVRSLALSGLFVLAVFYSIYFTRAILLPVVLAWLLSYLLRPVIRTFAGLKIAPPLSAAVVLL